MTYINQLEYEHIHYPTNMGHGGPEPGQDTVKSSGCGLCSLCMIVENLTVHQFPLAECLQLSLTLKANMKPGTDMKILGPAAAGRFGLQYQTTNSKEILLSHLQRGGMAIANVGGDREGYKGVFAEIGHYITILSCYDEVLTIFDPSQTPEKFVEMEKEDKIKVEGNFIYCHVDIVCKDCDNREPAFYLFNRPDYRPRYLDLIEESK